MRRTELSPSTCDRPLINVKDRTTRACSRSDSQTSPIKPDDGLVYRADQRSERPRAAVRCSDTLRHASTRRCSKTFLHAASTRLEYEALPLAWGNAECLSAAMAG